MVNITTLKPWYDRKHKRMRKANEVFEDTYERAVEVAEKLPGYVSFEAEQEDDLDSMTLRELKALAKGRGIKVSANASKASVVAALRG